MTIVAVAFICLLVFALIAFVIIPKFMRSKPSSKPPAVYDEIHVERAYDNDTWARLWAYCLDHQDVTLMLLVKYWDTPHQNMLVRERYAKLLELNNSLGLKVYIAVESEINAIPYEDQHRAIRFGRDYLEGLNINVTHFAPGWWSYNNNTVEACRATGLVNFHLWEPLTRGVSINKNMVVVPVREYIKDWQL